jgi:hypothetical protein
VRAVHFVLSLKDKMTRDLFIPLEWQLTPALGCAASAVVQCNRRALSNFVRSI